MADQRVEIVDYDLRWPELFAEERPAVEAVLAAWLGDPLEHVGSTAVPGLRAKPIIDMLAPVKSLTAAVAAVPVIERAGWMHWPQDPLRGYRLWFLKPRPQARTHHLQVVEADHPHAVALVAFRDALRADDRLRDEYARLKDQLAAAHPGNRNAYTNAKAEFVSRVLLRAGSSRPSGVSCRNRSALASRAICYWRVMFAVIGVNSGRPL
jgi:GrpB-like predicted nucleotidyltransferase (UPF0157 family)